MDYDFSSMCADQLEKLEKRLASFNKTLIKDYKIALNVINNQNERDHRSETMIEVEDILRDVVNKTQIFYTEALNKAQRLLVKHL